MSRPLEVLAVEPWLGGSHARFLEGWRDRSRHAVEVLGLPDRQWRWRMRDGARRLALEAARRPSPPDVLLASDYLDVPCFYGFLPGDWSAVPLVLYFHENQLTYARAPGRPQPDPERDRHFAYTHVLSCLRAERVVFNSAFHRAEFDQAARAFLRRLPEGAPRGAFARRMEAAAVVGPGVELERIPLGPGPAACAPLSIAFPHRREHDKDPLAFLEAVGALERRGLDFELHLFGQRYADAPPGTDASLERLAHRVVSDGYRPSFEDYARGLGRTDVVVSTARHEFYGIAVLEALAAGCAPLLPDRLSYPELVAGEPCLYGGPGELAERLSSLARDPAPLRAPGRRARWRELAARHDVARTAAALDDVIEALARVQGR